MKMIHYWFNDKDYSHFCVALVYPKFLVINSTFFFNNLKESQKKKSVLHNYSFLKTILNK